MKRLLLALCLLPSLSWAQTAYESHVTNLYAPTVFYYDTETSGTSLGEHGSFGTGAMTTHNTPTLNQSGVTATRGGAISWASASSQYANLSADNSGTGPGDFTTSTNNTVECWVNLTTLNVRTFTTANSETGPAATWNIGISGTGKATFGQFQTASDSVKYQVAGASTLSTGTWYFISFTWAGGSITSKAYVNGVLDGTSTTDFGGTRAGNSVKFWEQGRIITGTIGYADGKVQDCAVYGSVSVAGNILDRYNFGILASIGQTWPFLTKRPSIPNFRDDGWLEKVKNRGYMDGHFTPQAKEPLWLTVGWLPFSTLPPGNVR